jgi:hypothetical protein
MTYHRLLLAMSCVDILSSFWFLMITWPIPEGTPDVFAASDTQGSSATRGFFIQFNSASPLLNANLSVYYLLVMHYKWTEDRLRKTVQPILFSSPSSWASERYSRDWGLIYTIVRTIGVCLPRILQGVRVTSACAGRMMMILICTDGCSSLFLCALPSSLLQL